MNVALNPLQPAFDLMERMFGPTIAPAPITEEQRRADLEADARDSARQEFAHHRAPALATRFWRDDEKIDAAIAYAADRISVGMRLALRNEDDAEFARLFRTRMGVYINDEAAKAAEDEAFVAFPEVP